MIAAIWAVVAVLSTIVVVQSLAFLELLRQVVDIRAQLGEQGALIVPGAVETGELAPELAGVGASDLRPVSSASYLVSDLVLLLLLRPRCANCLRLAAQLTDFAAEIVPISVIVIVEARVNEALEFVDSAALDPTLVIIDEEGLTARRMGVRFNPGAITVQSGKLGYAGIVNDVSQLHAFVHEALPGKESRWRRIQATQEFLQALDEEVRA